MTTTERQIAALAWQASKDLNREYTLLQLQLIAQDWWLTYNEELVGQLVANFGRGGTLDYKVTTGHRRRSTDN